MPLSVGIFKNVFKRGLELLVISPLGACPTVVGGVEREEDGEDVKSTAFCQFGIFAAALVVVP
jgi:hypothetical protein